MNVIKVFVFECYFNIYFECNKKKIISNFRNKINLKKHIKN